MKKIKKNGFVEGTMIAYMAIIITKLIGAFYSIPFYGIIGERGGVIYSCAYNIYNLFLTVSTSGIPTAISIIISEYNSLKMFRAKEKAQRVARNTVFLISIIAFVLLFSLASLIGNFFLGDESGADVTLAIRTVSFCLLIVPFLSIQRGYLQGHAYIAPSSVSQVIEQFVRVFVILVGSYVAINVLHLSTAVGVSTALTGAFFGALAAYIYISAKIRKNRKSFMPAPGDVVNSCSVSTSDTLKKIFRICIPLIIVSVSSNIYDITDMKLVITGLSALDGYTSADSEVIASIIATWGPKICMMISALAMGLTSSLVPHMVSSYVKNDLIGVNKKFNQAINTVLMIALPMAVGMSMLAEPLYTVFYGQSSYGPSLMRLLPFTSVMASIGMVASMSLQSIGMAKVVCYTNITGLIVNAILDLPFIYLFDAMGIPAYLGAVVSSMIGYTISIGAVLVVLRKRLRFRYRAVVRLVFKVIIALAAMIVTVILLKLVIPFGSSGRLMQFVWLVVTALLGGGVYLLVSVKTNAISQVFGSDFFNKILKRLHLKK